jgi:hypothetical protein
MAELRASFYHVPTQQVAFTDQLTTASISKAALARFAELTLGFTQKIKRRIYELIQAAKPIPQI